MIIVNFRCGVLFNKAAAMLTAATQPGHLHRSVGSAHIETVMGISRATVALCQS
jgi:hypothetical protein